jgi:hypothetical protein
VGQFRALILSTSHSAFVLYGQFDSPKRIQVAALSEILTNRLEHPNLPEKRLSQRIIEQQPVYQVREVPLPDGPYVRQNYEFAAVLAARHFDQTT